MTIFTVEELADFDVPQLKRLGAYFGVDLSDEKIKEAMIQKIYSKIETVEYAASVSEPTTPIMSARVKRIYDRMKEK